MKQTSIFTPLLLAVAFALCLLMLTGCAPAAPVALPKATAEPTVETIPQTIQAPAALPTGSFLSADGSVEFTWNLGQTQELTAMPVVEVKPDFLTGEDMQNICHGLLGDVQFYDLGPRSQRQLTKAQLQKKIDIMNLYPDQKTLMDLWQSDDTAAIISVHREALGYLKKALETAPEENNLKPCDWTVKNEADYDDYMEFDGYQTLRATASVNGIDYNCDLFLNKEETDYCPVSNWMKFGLGDGSDYATVDFHTRAMLCSTPEPTQEQYDAVLQKAQAMLDNMGIGEYKAVNPRYDPNYFGSAERYEIYVDVVPVFEGVSALPGHWGQTYLEPRDYHTYGITRGMFSFSANGDLIHFDLGSLVEQTKRIDPAAEVLPLADLLNKAQDILTAYDPGVLRNSAGYWNIWERSNESMTCKVNISGVDYGLARYSVDGSDDTFFYTPAIVCKGTVEYYDKATGDFITSSDLTSSGIGQAPLVVLDAIGGGVI